MKTRQGHNLVSDFAHRDPKDKLHDVDCGHYMAVLSTFSHNLRQLLEDSSMFVEMDEISKDYYRPSRIIKKREAEFNQGTEVFFAYSSDGKRVNLSEEDYNHLLGLQKNPEDVMEHGEMVLTSFESEYTSPHDSWDITFDCSDANIVWKQLTQSDSWQTHGLLPDTIAKRRYSNPDEYTKRVEHIQKVHTASVINSYKRSDMEWIQNELVYSADWFPYPRDKRLHHPRAKKIAQIILNSDLSKAELGRMLADNTVDKRFEISQDLIRRASNMPMGKSRAKLLVQAQKTKAAYFEARKNKSTAIPQTDKTKLWELWTKRQLEIHGKTKTTSWQFHKMLSGKLIKLIQKGELSLGEAEARLNQAMQNLYGVKSWVKLYDPTEATNCLFNIPERNNSMKREMNNFLKQFNPEQLQKEEKPFTEESESQIATVLTSDYFYGGEIQDDFYNGFEETEIYTEE